MALTSSLILSSTAMLYSFSMIPNFSSIESSIDNSVLRVFYVSRLVSSQKERDFVKTNYNDIKRVFSTHILSQFFIYRNTVLSFNDP